MRYLLKHIIVPLFIFSCLSGVAPFALNALGASLPERVLPAVSYSGAALETPTLVDLIEIMQLNSGRSLSYNTFPLWLDWDKDNKISLTDGLILLKELENPSPLRALPGNYTLLAWNDLGMHCVDGNDYSIFSILPPFNNLHVQLVNKNNGLVTAGVHLTFESALSLNGSWNTTSVEKTNFWQYAETLYGFFYGGGPLPADQGLTGVFVQSRSPQEMTFDSSNQWWAADGIPILPYNDDGSKNYYQLVNVKALDANGDLLARATAVLPVSDEMDCRKCHSSASNYGQARPDAGWVNDSDPEKDYKLNILRLHDETHATTLLAEAKGGVPVLCSGCHLSNALPGTGRDGITPLTTAIHSRHAQVLDPATNQTLNAATNRTACYSCHPGEQTACLRGAMGGSGNINCQDCHGGIADVGAKNRQGWLDEPTCQQCHQDGNRYSSAFVSPGNLRPVTDRRFATNLNTPLSGKELYRYSTGHSGLQCESCHGATHAIYPSVDAEDNILAEEIQGYAGTISDCLACHSSTPRTTSGGPHGLHTIGQYWLSAHRDAAKSGGTASCASCHGTDFRGSQLSAVFADRSFSVGGRTKSFTAGQSIGCYDCHNGPKG